MLINVTKSNIITSPSAQAGRVWLSPSRGAGGHTRLAWEGGTAGGVPSLEQRPQPSCWGESRVVPTFQEQQSGMAKPGVYWCSMAVLGCPAMSPTSGSVLPLASATSWPPSLGPRRPVLHPDSISCLSKDQAGQQSVSLSQGLGSLALLCSFLWLSTEMALFNHPAWVFPSFYSRVSASWSVPWHPAVDNEHSSPGLHSSVLAEAKGFPIEALVSFVSGLGPLS